FFRQWRALKKNSNHHGLSLIGDGAIFVSIDSADVWANPHLFLLHHQRRPAPVAGVAPAYLFAPGQLLGEPPYNLGTPQRANFWLVGAATQGSFVGRRSGPIRSFPRLRCLLGGASGPTYRRSRPLGQSPGCGVTGAPAPATGRPAAHRRGSGRDHTRGGSLARSLPPAGHADPAVCLLGGRQRSLFAAQFRA